MAETEPLREQRRWMTVASAVTVVLILAFVFYLLRLVILPFGVSAALAFLAAPVVRRLHQKTGWPHWCAALLIYVGYLAVIGLAGFGAVRYVVPEFFSVVSRAPQITEHLLTVAFRGPHLHALGQTFDAKTLANSAIEQFESMLRDPGKLIFAGVSSISGLIGFFLTLALLGYFLFQGPELARGLLWLIPPKHRRRARILAGEVEPVVYNYVRGVIVIVAYAMVTTGLVTGFILHLPHAVLLAIAVGLLESIPMVGPALALILLGFVVAERATPALLFGFGIFAAALRMSIDNLIAPIVLGRYVMLPPPVIIFAFLAGGVVFGFVGVVLAIPAAAAIRVILADLYGDRRMIKMLRKGAAELHQEAPRS
ncbi:MAG: AI-2E family transporter [Vulcanimicrobiaceae bacterium]